MADTLQSALSRRERQIMDALFALGETGVTEVARALPDQPAYNTVRVMLGILEKKGFVSHRQEGQRYVYRPTIPREKAQQSAMRHVLKTFFQGSPSAAILALLGQGGGGKLSRRELDEIAQAIAQARKKEG